MPTAKKTYRLIIVESPAKAHTIKKFLKGTVHVVASNGHVRDLPRSQMGVDVENDFEPKYITIRGRGEVLAALRKEKKGAGEILIATDPDREGEAIAWHLAQIMGVDPAAACRIEFNEITEKAVKEAVKHPRAIDMERVNAQQARRVLDRLVGYGISPLLWQKIKKGLSAGRVQSVATRMITEREDEVNAFIPEEYWNVTASLTINGQPVTAKLHPGELANETVAMEAAHALEKARLTVLTMKNAERKRNPAAPFTTSSLQQEASLKLKYAPGKTMQIAQILYEGVAVEGHGVLGLISYIRTDSVRLSDEALTAARAHIEATYGPAFLPETPNVYKGRSRAQDAHEAIRPTDVMLTPEMVKPSLTKEQFNLYRLVYMRFVASQMTPAVYDTQTAEIAGDSLTLRFYGERKRFAGFTSVYEESEENAPDAPEKMLPKLQVGDQAAVVSVTPSQHFTQPPPRFTEASLVKALEEQGIGRPSTYAPTLSTLAVRGYITKEQRKLYPTELGRMINTLMCEYFPNIVSSQFTAQMEDELDEIADGKLPWRGVIKEFYAPFDAALQNAAATLEKIEVKPEVSDELCPLCGAPLLYKMSRYGKFLACSRFPECRGTKPILVTIPVPCPTCGGTLLEKISRKGRVFYGCQRYPECAFVSWDKPVDKNCPVCGTYRVLKQSRKGNILLCTNEQCRHREEVQEQEEET